MTTKMPLCEAQSLWAIHRFAIKNPLAQKKAMLLHTCSHLGLSKGTDNCHGVWPQLSPLLYLYISICPASCLLVFALFSQSVDSITFSSFG
jgi:hypothetical protein